MTRAVQCLKCGFCFTSLLGHECEHPEQAKQREQMHKIVAADAKLRRDEMAELRRRAAERDARRNEPITRGEVIDAINHAMHMRGGNVGDHHEADMEVLRALREAFE